jgi:hypothetical protein
MTIAELHGKLAEGRTTGYEYMEDLLTSDIFGTMRYARWECGFAGWRLGRRCGYTPGPRWVRRGEAVHPQRAADPIGAHGERPRAIHNARRTASPSPPGLAAPWGTGAMHSQVGVWSPGVAGREIVLARQCIVGECIAPTMWTAPRGAPRATGSVTVPQIPKSRLLRFGGPTGTAEGECYLS